MGRKKKELPPTSNDAVMYTMMRQNPEDKFSICPICNQWALIWSDATHEDLYYGMHPMGCFDTSAGQKKMYEIRQVKKTEFNQPLFDLGE